MKSPPPPPPKNSPRSNWFLNRSTTQPLLRLQRRMITLRLRRFTPEYLRIHRFL